METAIVGVFLRSFVGCILLAASTGKFLDPKGAKRAAMDYGVPERWVGFSARLLPIVEFALGTALVLQLFPLIAPIGTLLLLLAFFGATLRVIALGQLIDCHCFGSFSREQVGVWTVIRLIGLLLLTVAVTVIDLSVVRLEGLLLSSPVSGGLPTRITGLVVASLAAGSLILLGQVIATFGAVSPLPTARTGRSKR